MAVAGQWKKVVYCFTLKKVPETSDDLTCYMFSLEDAVAHLSVIETLVVFYGLKSNRGCAWVLAWAQGSAQQDRRFSIGLWCHVILLPLRGP